MIALIDCGSNKVGNISSILENSTTVQIIRLQDIDYKVLNHFKAVVISGAPILLTEINPLPYINSFEWVKEYLKPILGICFGHQILGLQYGAQITSMIEDRQWQEIILKKQDPLFEGIAEKFFMQEDHCEHITLPKAFKLLASSKSCQNEAMKHKTKPHYGVQFHPEVSTSDGELLINNFVRLALKVST